MNFIDEIRKRFAANPKLAWSFLVTAIAIIIHNFPGVIAWMPQELQSTVQTTAYGIITSSVLAALWWAKQHNTSGTGATMDPLRKPDSTGGTKTIE